MSILDGQCRDVESQTKCSRWKRKKMCGKNWVKKKCLKTCGECKYLWFLTLYVMLFKKWSKLFFSDKCNHNLSYKIDNIMKVRMVESSQQSSQQSGQQLNLLLRNHLLQRHLNHLSHLLYDLQNHHQLLIPQVEKIKFLVT